MYLPKNVEIISLVTHEDERGDLTEVFRESWKEDFKALQWNIVNSKANVLRGVHVHINHTDYLTCVKGSLHLGLVDMRSDSKSFGESFLITLKDGEMQAVVIPPGVAHGFCFSEDATFLYSVSHYWDKNDELGFKYNDPHVKIDWPVKSPILSKKDLDAPSFQDVLAKLEGKLPPLKY